MLAVLAVVGLAAARALALNPAEKPTDYIATRWDTEDGLPHNSVRQIFQTRDGYLWVSTAQGLARFDGLTFTVFTSHNTPGLSNSLITSFAETPDGSLWMGTSFGLTRYQHGSFTSYGEADGVVSKSGTINAVCLAPDGSLWIGGGSGITRWVDGQFVHDIDTSAFSTRSLHAITVDRQHAIWLIVGSEALRYTGGKFQRFGRAEGLPAERLAKLCVDAQGRLIAVTENGLLRLENERFVPIELTADLSSERVHTVLFDRASNLWIGSVAGLDRSSGGKVEPYVDRNGNKLGVVNTLFEDREGCLWIGTSSGLYRLTDRRAHTLSTKEGGVGALAVAITQTRDHAVWISSWANGVNRLQDGTFTRYNPDLSPSRETTVTTIYEAPDGTMWLGDSNSSLNRLQGGKITTFVYQSGLPSRRFVSAILADGDVLLVGISKRGLLQLRNGAIVPVPEAAEFAPDTVWLLQRMADGRLLMGTSKGLYERRADRTWQPVAIRGLAEPVVVRALHEEADGTIWLATDGLGLVRWKNGEGHAYDARRGMLDDTLFSVLDDNLGSLWVTSGRGIARYRKVDFAILDHGEIPSLDGLSLGHADGLLSASGFGTGNPGAIRLADGRLMTATDQGVAVIDPHGLPVNRQPPPVVIERVVADDRPLSPGPAVSIPAGTNRLEIRYTALSLIAPQRLRFRYRLEGSDSAWVEAGQARTAHYTHLTPGDYTFRVLACNNDGLWNEIGATLALKVQPQFYQTLWFRLVAVALLAAFLVSLFWLRARQMNRRQEALRLQNAELDQRVQERTAELSRSNEELRQGELDREKLHRRLLDVSRQAGMAEVATNVLHNVGNVLNSVNVSAGLVIERVSRSKAPNLAKVVELLDAHRLDLGAFLTADARGKHVPAHLAQLAKHLLANEEAMVSELDSLRRNVEHIKEIVAVQQDYATFGGVKELIDVVELVEDSLRISEGSLSRHEVSVVREFAQVPRINVEKHKILQILVNLLHNAKHACQESARGDKRLTVRVANGAGRIKIRVSDNGVGIAPENLNRIFNHGFTTRPDGHGFGLHSGALAAKEMGGSLLGESAGADQGATFTLELPCPPPGERP